MSLYCGKCHKEVAEPMNQHLPKCPGPDKVPLTERTIFLTPEEVKCLRMVLGLLNSMILSGEQHSDGSQKEFRKAINILNGGNNE